MRYKNEIMKYANEFLKEQFKIDWVEQQLDKDIKTTQTEMEHIIDYLAYNKRYKRLDRATFEQIKIKTEQWNKALQKKGKDIIEKNKIDYEVIKKWWGGFKFVKLKSKRAYDREGHLMRHCVFSYYGQEDNIYSLRDRNNKPHCTISQSSQQIKGKGNGCIHPKYIKYVVEFLEHLDIKVRDSEMLNLGYANVEKFKDKLHKKTIKELFRNKYWYMENDLLDKKGNEFFTLDLFDIKPLIKETRTGLKINYNLFKCLNNLEIKENYSKLASSGNYSKLASSGYNSKLASSGDNSNLAINGKNSVGANIGYKGKIKGIIGTWITLAEYDENNKIIYVKSSQIDGIKLKENVWYTLKNKRFIEVEENGRE